MSTQDNVMIVQGIFAGKVVKFQIHDDSATEAAALRGT